MLRISVVLGAVPWLRESLNRDVASIQCALSHAYRIVSIYLVTCGMAVKDSRIGRRGCRSRVLASDQQKPECDDGDKQGDRRQGLQVICAPSHHPLCTTLLLLCIVYTVYLVIRTIQYVLHHFSHLSHDTCPLAPCSK